MSAIADPMKRRRNQRPSSAKAGGKSWQGRGCQITFWLMWPALACVAILTYPGSQPFDEGGGDGGAAAAHVMDGAHVHPQRQRDGSSSSSTAVPQRPHVSIDSASGGESDGGTSDGTPPHVVSRCHIHAAPCGTGLVNKYYHRFENVHLTRRQLTVYYGGGFVPPAEEAWVDLVTGNSTRPVLPTMMVIKGELQEEPWYWLPVKYLPASAHQPHCASWIEKPTFLLQARYSYNIWHTWNEGLMGLFQTLRELGYLPLASVDGEGRMGEIVDGMGGGCAWEYDAGVGLVERDHCDPRVDSWCRGGAVVSTRRSSGGPVILPFTPSSLKNAWGHLYSAMSEDVRQWAEVEGACFRNLIVGKTPTLNFYQPISRGHPRPRAHSSYPWVDIEAARVEAMAVFKAFVTSAQREWVEVEAGKSGGAGRWGGYRSPGMERLRRGVGPEDAGDEAVLSAINPREVPGMIREEEGELKMLAAKRARWAAADIRLFKEQYGGAAAAREAAREQGLDVADYYDDYEAKAARAAKRMGTAAGGGSSPSGAGDQRRGAVEEAQQGGSTQAGDALQGQQQQQRVVVQRRRRRRLRSSLDGADGTDSSGAGRAGSAASSNPLTLQSGAGKDSPQQQQPAEPLLRRAAAPPAPPRRWFDKHAVFRHERPRPVVTYLSRNFFSRGVLNERDVLAYIINRYDVTLRVTTFEEPLLEVMELLGSTDVMFGMHGAGWTNGLFIKRGATAQQLFPYGWRLPNNSTVRGFNYREIVFASECRYSEWVNPHRELAFFRRMDYPKGRNLTFSLHPDPAWALPRNGWPGNPWVYQNTYLDMDHYGPAIDAMMRQAGIKPMQGVQYDSRSAV